ncbi:uncharacterized protein LOC144916924 [Branchiostoma floridae x Branchiostoma belcheri]
MEVPSRPMSFFMLAVLFTLSVMWYYYFATFDITSTNFSVKAIQSRILLRQTFSDSHILAASSTTETTTRTPKVTKPFRSTIARKRTLDINVEKNLTRTPKVTKPFRSTIARKRTLDINVEKNLTRRREEAF